MGLGFGGELRGGVGVGSVVAAFSWMASVLQSPPIPLPLSVRRAGGRGGLLPEGAEGAGTITLGSNAGAPTRATTIWSWSWGPKGAEGRLRRGATRAYGAEVEGGLKSYSRVLPIGHKTTQGLPYLLRTVLGPLVSRRMMWWSHPRTLAVG
jgi:hypothetical protein